MLASVTLVDTVGAQPQPTSAPGDVGFIGIPEYTSTETGIPFYFRGEAQFVDELYRRMRRAIANCDRPDYDRAAALRPSSYSTRFPDEPGVSLHVHLAREARDIENAQRARDNVPPFPANCTPPGSGPKWGPFEVYVIGGGTVPLGVTGAVTGVDSFFGTGRFLIDNRTNGASSTATPLVGTRLRLNFKNIEPGQPGFLANVRIFAESGIQSAFGAQSFIQTFSGVSAMPLGFGSNTVKENFQIPILIGVGVPLTSGDRTPVFFDGYGGVTISNSTQTLQGREAGAPAGSGFFAAQTRTTVDPTVGIGLRAIFNNLSAGGAALPPLIIGANAELSVRPGNVVQAQSSNFPSESYYGTVDPRANVAFMFRVGIPFGGTR